MRGARCWSAVGRVSTSSFPRTLPCGTHGTRAVGLAMLSGEGRGLEPVFYSSRWGTTGQDGHSRLVEMLPLLFPVRGEHVSGRRGHYRSECKADVNSEPGPGVIAVCLVNHSLLHREWALLRTQQFRGRFHSSLHAVQGTTSQSKKPSDKISGYLSGSNVLLCCDPLRKPLKGRGLCPQSEWSPPDKSLYRLVLCRQCSPSAWSLGIVQLLLMEKKEKGTKIKS